MEFVFNRRLPRWSFLIVSTLMIAAFVATAGRLIPPVSAQACTWTGKWNIGNNTTLTLTQTGTQVSGGDGGNYGFNGTVSGNSLTGSWSYGSDRGAVIATMDPSCNSFAGYTGLNGSSSVTPQTGQPLNGTRVGSPAPTPSASPSPSSGSSGQLQKLGSVNWSAYCKSQGYADASLDGGTINDWHCVDSSGKKVGVDVGAICQWQYQAGAVGRWDTFNDPNSWACFGVASGSGGQGQKLGSVNWSGYCKSQGYADASLDGGTINDWHCVDSSGKKVGVDVGAICKWQYQPNAVGRWDTFNDPNSWACFGTSSSSSNPSSPPANTQSVDWSTNAADHSQDIGKQFSYSCPPGGTANNVWGTDTYTDDSSICTAAVHAQLISFASGGTVTIQMTAGQSSYSGSTRNGVSTNDWGSWDASYRFVH